MTQQRFLLVVLALTLLLPGCQEKPKNPPGPPELLAASVAQVGKTVTLRCYDFAAKNNTDKKLTDVHIQLVRGDAELPSAPKDWTPENGPGHELIFKTPPPRDAGTGENPRENPVAPGGSLGGFRFYLSGSTDSRLA